MPILNEEISPQYWEIMARENIYYSQSLLGNHMPKSIAKNVILFLGDGMGFPTIAASRFFRANIKNCSGFAMENIFESWPFSTMARTYDLETMVTDSASSATAYLTGTKTRTGMIGLTGAVKLRECRSYTDDEKTESVLKAAAKAGKATGIVTTTRVTHASPAGTYGSVAYRKWESDADISIDVQENYTNCVDLAKQLVLENSNINVILGGGQENFLPNYTICHNNGLQNNCKLFGKRLDNLDLIKKWEENHKLRGDKAIYVSSMEEILKPNITENNYILGLFAPSHLPSELDRKPYEPSLANLTKLAIEILKKQDKGFFLFVEGGQIDLAHHINLAKSSLTEMLAFNEAITMALGLVDLSETLIIVTADHSHAFELMGRPSRFQNLLELDNNYAHKTLDGRNMLSVGYINGPGAQVNNVRLNLTGFTNLTHNDFQQPALVPLKYSSHTGEDVGVYASGPYSWLFHQTIDNTFIAHAMKYAMRVGPYEENQP